MQAAGTLVLPFHLNDHVVQVPQLWTSFERLLAMLNTAPGNERKVTAQLEAGATLPRWFLPTFFLQHMHSPFFVPLKSRPMIPHDPIKMPTRYLTTTAGCPVMILPDVVP